MRYIIQNILSDEVAKYHNDLVQQIAEKFDIHFTYAQPPHFTLKYIFETDHTRDLELMLKKFANNHKAHPVTIGGFDNFEQRVFFLKVIFSDSAIFTFREYIDTIKTIDWLTWNQFDGYNLNFHSTLVHDCGNKFDKIRAFLSGKEKYFETKFDNLSILKNTGVVDEISVWELHKRYNLEK